MFSLKKNRFILCITIVFSLLPFNFSQANGLVLGPKNPAAVEKIKYENLFKPNQGAQTIEVESSSDSKVRVNLNIPKHNYIHDFFGYASAERSEEVIAAYSSNKSSSLYYSEDRIALPLNYDHLPEKQRIIAEAIRNVSVSGIAAFAVLFALPEDVTNWSHNQSFTELLDEYDDNIKAGPVVDKDSWIFNYFIHPLNGAYLYLILRKQGFSKMDSFGFAFFVSTVLWEYGIEAIAEIPSIQDLIITPVAGAVFGEMFHQWSLHLKEQDYRLAGSHKLGRLVHTLINPVEGINRGLNRVFRSNYFKLKNASVVLQDKNKPFRRFGGEEELYQDQELTLGIRFLFKFR